MEMFLLSNFFFWLEYIKGNGRLATACPYFLVRQVFNDLILTARYEVTKEFRHALLLTSFGRDMVVYDR